MILSKNFQDIIYQAITFSVNQLNHQYLTPEHVLFCALDDKNIAELMKNCMIDVKQLKNQLFHHLSYDLVDLTNKNTIIGEKDLKAFDLKFTSSLVALIEKVIIHCYDCKRTSASILDFLLEFTLDCDLFGSYFLRNAHLSANDIIQYKNYLQEIEDLKTMNNSPLSVIRATAIKSTNNPQDKSFDFITNDNFDTGFSGTFIYGATKEKKNSILEQFCTNFNVKATQNKVDNVISRDKELDIIIKSLCCRRKGNSLLIGDSGVGKTAIVEYLAKKIISADKDIPKKFKNSVVYSLDLNSLISGTRYRGDLEERLKNIMIEIENTKFPIILFIDEIHTVIGTGSTNNGTLDIGNILKPYLARGVIFCIGATTRKEFSLYLAKDKAFLRRFQIITVNEPSEEDACKMITGIIKNYENFHKVTYSKNSIETAVKLSKRYIVERQLPDVALDIIDFAGSATAINKECHEAKTSIVNSRNIEEVIISFANLPNKKIHGNEMRKMLSLEEDLKKVIVGQNDAITKVCSSILINKAGLHDEQSNKPMASYIFYGPTGVGKTELAVQLAKLLNMNLMRIDMSEYSESHSVSKLFGSPPGYVGFDQSGILSEEILKNPHTVILFDEIEKSHQSVHNSLLQILDYGFITDNFSRKINFSNTIIICTTNTASKSMDKITPGFGSIENDTIIDRELEEMFSPEFRNRFSSIIRFHHLEKDIIKQIVERELGKIKQLFSKKHINFVVGEQVKNFIIKHGYNRRMGARPIDRIINDKIKIKLAPFFMQNNININEMEEEDDGTQEDKKVKIKKKKVELYLEGEEVCIKN